MKKFFLASLVFSLFFIPRYAHSTRYMWCWNNDSITNNVGSARTDFFNFCAAPFGDTTKAITYLWYFAGGDVSGNQSNLRNFIASAHSHGIKVLYLDGNPDWITSQSGIMTAESIVSTVLLFNAATSDDSLRFDGVHYDVEPQSATNWNSNQTTYWSNFTALLSGCQAEVNAYNSTHSPTIPFELDISRNWDIGLPVVSNTQVQNIVDAVAVMNYVNHFSSITADAMGEITYANSIGKKVVVGYDTGNDSPSSSTFYGLGDTVMENDFAIAEPVFSAYSSYQGIAIEYYDPYRNLFTSAPPSPGFYGTPTSGAGPLTVKFTDTSGNSPTSWNWNFGDGSTATSQNPTHIYADLGVVTSYSVTLIASNSYGTTTAIQPNYISLNINPPSAGFFGTPISGGGPLSVNFTDTSGNNPSSWNWDFGDGSTSNTKNPTHTYASVTSASSYTVTLVASNTYGNSTAIKLNYISVSTAVAYAGGIIWDFDTKNPAKILRNAYLYLYNNVNTNGIGGSSALEMDVPYEAVGARHGGGGFWLSNYAGFALQPTAPYLGTVGNTANNLNLSSDTIVYFSILASNTSNFGVSFSIYDTTGSSFIPNGRVYIGDSTQLQGSISTTAFQQLAWNITSMHAYNAGHTSGRQPVTSNIEALLWFFPTNKNQSSGQGSGPSALKFFIENVGAKTGNQVPIELWNKY